MIISILHKQLQTINVDTRASLDEENRNNEIYFDFLILFLRSLAITNPIEEVYLKLFDFSEKECRLLKTFNKNLIIENYSSIDAKEPKERNDLEKERQLALLCLLVEKAKTNKKIIYMDVDCLVRKDIKGIYNILDQNDLAIQTWKTSGPLYDYANDRSGEVDDNVKLCSGVMAFKGKKALNFLKEWESELKNQKEISWFTGQNILYHLYKKYTENDLISFFDLSQNFHDMHLTSNSSIWHGNITITKTKKDNLNAFAEDFSNNIETNTTRLIDGLLEKHEDELNEILTCSNFVNIFEKCQSYSNEVGAFNDGSTGMVDCKFLQLLCLERRPKKILEVGTWVGATAYSMAFATKDIGTTIYTCDNQNAFVYSNELVAQRIRIFPNTWSSQLLDYGILNGIDFIFNDAILSDEDCEKIYNLADKEFCFATHDYYDGLGDLQKGHWAISSMLKVLEKKNAKYEIYLPKKEWFPKPTSIEGYRGINGCCAMLVCNK